MELRDLVQVYNDKKNKDQGPECDYGFKLIIVGDASAGKSSFMHQFLAGKFRKQSTHTIGVEFGTKIISLGQRKIKLQIWDTAGQERYRAVTRSYYRGAVGALILYDVTSRDSFNNLPTWLQDAREQAWKDISIIAVGNKRDLKEERQVSFLEASRFVQEQDILFMETSALTGENVQEAFNTLAQRILNKVEEGMCDPADTRIGNQSYSQFDGRAIDSDRGRAPWCGCRSPTSCITS
jgi:Ras-related protein Rab-4B